MIHKVSIWLLIMLWKPSTDLAIIDSTEAGVAQIADTIALQLKSIVDVLPYSMLYNHLHMDC